MKKLIRLVVMMGLAVSGLASLADEVLYWMLDNPTITDWYNTQYNLADRNTTVKGNEMVIARVAAFQDQSGAQSYAETRLSGEFAGDIVYLDLYYNIGTEQQPNWTLDIPNNSNSIIADGRVDPSERASIYASLAFDGKVPGTDLNAFSFAIELGTYDDDGQWVLAAISGTETYGALTGYISDQVAMPKELPWTPNAFAAPEPTSGLLMVIGFALLGLKRKKVVGCHNRGRDVLVASKEMKTALI